MDVYIEDNFRKEFRMSKAEIMNIFYIVEDELYTKGCRKMDQSIEEKVLISIKTLTSGSFQNCSKDFIKVPQPTVSNKVFTDCLSKTAKQFINMPRNHAEEEAIKSEFYGIAGFPGVLGCIHGTHIPVIAPSRDECAYINRKNFHSINVQGVGDLNMIFEDVVAKWLGSHHDSFILQSSSLYQNLKTTLSVMLGFLEIAVIR